MSRIKKTIIPAAGLGTRFLPATKAQPKEMLPIVEKPTIENAPSNVAVLGRYIITPGIFKHLEKQEIGAGGEIQLTDALCRLAKEEKMYAYDFIGRI